MKETRFKNRLTALGMALSFALLWGCHAQPKQETEAPVTGQGTESTAPAAQSPAGQPSSTPQEQAPQGETTTPTAQAPIVEKPSASAGTTSTTKPDAQTSTTPAASEQVTAPPVTEAPVADACTIAIFGDGKTIVDATTVELAKGDTVLSILKEITRKNGIQMEYRGSGGNAYVEGIDNLYEFDQGPQSGWIFSVNGAYLNSGCGTYTPAKGDVIQWHYTKEMGRDLGANITGQ